MSDVIQLLGKVLDGAALRQRVLAHNLANLNTPGYTRQDVEFRQILADAVKSKSETALAQASPRVQEDTTAPVRPDGNNVSLQTELGYIAGNGLLYDFATRATTAQYRMLLSAIRGR